MFELADNRSPNSMASKMRSSRHAAFCDLLREVRRPTKALDVGGSEEYWRSMGFLHDEEVELTIVNTLQPQGSIPRLRWILADARDMSGIADQEYDVVFCNSMLEHVGALDDQEMAASEIRRVARRYFVQTPNRWFPVEPHSLFPFFQFLPAVVRAWLLRTIRLGWLERAKSMKEARSTVSSIRLLDRKEMGRLFPEAILVSERFVGLSKSIIACGGWEVQDVLRAFAGKVPRPGGFKVDDGYRPQPDPGPRGAGGARR